jgi:RNA-directed DNA polymerase
MDKKVYNRWVKYFDDIGLQQHIKDVYLEYIRTLLNNNVPVIFEFNHLAKLIGITNQYLASVINSSENHYREFTIPKRSGGSRSITAPYPTLKFVQYWIYNNILIKQPVHNSCHGFVKKRSIISNVKVHLGCKCLLKIDIKDYFPSITINRVISIFRKYGYANNVSFYLASICCLNGVVPQGAPTSPYLSNIVSFIMDVRLFKLTKKYNLSYTRYADDITFSGEYIPIKFIDIVKTIINENGFEINQDKIRLIRDESRKKIVTGIYIDNNKMKVPRSYKRELKKELYYINTYGYLSHVSKMKIRKPYYIYSILGKLNYWKDVEPGNLYVKENIKKIKSIIKNISH